MCFASEFGGAVCSGSNLRSAWCVTHGGQRQTQASGAAYVHLPIEPSDQRGGLIAGLCGLPEGLAQQSIAFDAAMPFGGYEESGSGREMGHNALEDYLETESVVIQLA
jgi:hypothetical protein